MSKRIVFRSAADAEFIESIAWYENQREGLGQEFIGHVQHVLDRIVEDPLAFPAVSKNTREVPVSKFPYAVYYRIKSDYIIILAVFHCSRDPAVWQSRN